MSSRQLGGLASRQSACHRDHRAKTGRGERMNRELKKRNVDMTGIVTSETRWISGLLQAPAQGYFRRGV